MHQVLHSRRRQFRHLRVFSMAVLFELDGKWQWQRDWDNSWLQGLGNEVSDEQPFPTTSRHLLGDECHAEESDAGNYTQSLATDHGEL